MASENISNYEGDRIFLIQPLKVETCKFFAEGILNSHNEAFYQQAYISKFEAVGNSFFCTSCLDAEQISTCLNRFSDIKLSFMIFDVTDSFESIQLAKIQLGEAVKTSLGIRELLAEYTQEQNMKAGNIEATDKFSAGLAKPVMKKRKLVTLKLKLRLAIDNERYEDAARIRDEILKHQ